MTKFYLIFIALISLFFSPIKILVAQQEIPTLPKGKVAGQVEGRGERKKIYFESGVFVEWSGPLITLVDGFHKNKVTVNLSATPEKVTARKMLGENVEEQDLGGTPKKRPPLAHKNPKVREVHFSRRAEDPLKGSGLKPKQVSEEKTPEGGKLTTLVYPDESKSTTYVSSTLKEESAYNRKGMLIWKNVEGEDQGVQFRRTQWEDGSIVREYLRPQGILSTVFDTEKNTQRYSFLNSNREILKEVVCFQGSCEE